MTALLTINSHCPWIDNCVGANNLRHFVLYIVSLQVGIILFVQLTIACEYPSEPPINQPLIKQTSPLSPLPAKLRVM